MTSTHELLSTVASAATAMGVAVAAWQLRIVRLQDKSAFERQFSDRYRTIRERLPLMALIGNEDGISWDECDDDLKRALFDYFELCEEEVFYRSVRRVSKRTWFEWAEGMQSNLRNPVFRVGWHELSAAAPQQFTDFRAVINAEGSFSDPPRRWRRVGPLA